MLRLNRNGYSIFDFYFSAHSQKGFLKPIELLLTFFRIQYFKELFLVHLHGSFVQSKYTSILEYLQN